MPKEVDTAWESEDPRAFMAAKIKAHIEALDEQAEGAINRFNEFENRYEQPELAWMADYCIHNLIFLKSQLKLTDPIALAILHQGFWDTLNILNME